MPVVLRAIHVPGIVLRTGHFVIHRTIVHAPIYPIIYTPVDSIVYTPVDSIVHAPVDAIVHTSINTIVHTSINAIVHTPINPIIHAMISDWPRDHIMSTEFSRPRSSCDRRTSMIHRRQKFPVTARAMLVFHLHMRSLKVPLVHEPFITT
jgi:hypothetical protein